MEGKSKERSKVVWGSVFNVLYTFIFLFVLLITVNALYGTIAKRQPTVFGYSVSEIQTGSMVASGFEVGDFVVTKKVSSKDDIKVGDIITFYVHTANKRPVLKGESRSSIVPIFHEVIGVNADGHFITKGSSNLSADDYPVPFESVSGVYTDNGPFLDFIVKIFLSGSRFLYWVVGVLLIMILRYIVLFFLALRIVKVQNQIVKRRRHLLDKQSFVHNVFGEFTSKTKQRLINESAHGLEILYEYLLFNSINGRSNVGVSNALKGKRCSIADVLCITYSGERGSEINRDEYILNLPKKNKEFDKYRNISEYRSASLAEKRTAFSMFLGCVAFTLVYALIALLSKSLQVTIIYELILVGAVPLVAGIYLMLVVRENNQIEVKLEKYLRESGPLPDRYQFIIKHDDYSAEEINENIAEIEQRLNEGYEDWLASQPLLNVYSDESLLLGEGTGAEKPDKVIVIEKTIERVVGQSEDDMSNGMGIATEDGYMDNSYMHNAYMHNSYMDNSYADNSYADNSYNDYVHNSYDDDIQQHGQVERFQEVFISPIASPPVRVETFDDITPQSTKSEVKKSIFEAPKFEEPKQERKEIHSQADEVEEVFLESIEDPVYTTKKEAKKQPHKQENETAEARVSEPTYQPVKEEQMLVPLEQARQEIINQLREELMAQMKDQIREELLREFQQENELRSKEAVKEEVVIKEIVREPSATKEEVTELVKELVKDLVKDHVKEEPPAPIVEEAVVEDEQQPKPRARSKKKGVNQLIVDASDVAVGAKYHPLNPTKLRWNGSLSKQTTPTKSDL